MYRKIIFLKITFLAIISILMIFCFSLSACDPGRFNFTNDYLSDIISIELIHYDKPNQKQFVSWSSDHTPDLKQFDETKMNILENLNEDLITDFKNYLCKCDVLYKYFAYDSPNGKCIKLNYSNGNFLIIWSNYEKNIFNGFIGKFSIDGKVVEFIGCFESLADYKDLVKTYFKSQI